MTGNRGRSRISHWGALAHWGLIQALFGENMRKQKKWVLLGGLKRWGVGGAPPPGSANEKIYLFIYLFSLNKISDQLPWIVKNRCNHTVKWKSWIGSKGHYNVNYLYSDAKIVPGNGSYPAIIINFKTSVKSISFSVVITDNITCPHFPSNSWEVIFVCHCLYLKLVPKFQNGCSMVGMVWVV